MRYVIILAICAAFGCDKEGVVAITVDAAGVVSGVAKLRATVTHGANTSRPVIFKLPAPTTIPPAQTLSLGVPPDRTGPIMVTIDALDSGDRLLASAKGTGTVEAGNSTTVKVTLPGIAVRRWVVQSSNTKDGLYGVWGDGKGRVFVVGGSNAGATILTTTNGGAEWSPVAAGTNILLFRVWGSAPDDVYASGPLGVIVRWDGTTWKALNTNTTDNILTVWGSSTTVYALAQKGVLLSSMDRGNTWQSRTIGNGMMLFTIGGASQGNIIGAGLGGLILRSTDSAMTWESRVSGTTKQLNAIWAHSSGSIFVVGYDGAIVYSDTGGAQWKVQDGQSNVTLYGVWGSGPKDVYAVGFAGTILHSTDSGVTWLPMPSGTTEALGGIWGSGPNDVYAVGGNGTILHLE